jgi:hypothetical protein
MKKECPHCSCYATPIKEDGNEYCVMCEKELNTPPSFYKDEEEEESNVNQN